MSQIARHNLNSNSWDAQASKCIEQLARRRQVPLGRRQTGPALHGRGEFHALQLQGPARGQKPFWQAAQWE